MWRTIELLRRERRAAVFFAALAQSGLGTGAGYVALLVVAYERFESPWAISLVLAADLVPAMVLGPVFGAAADRFSRRTCTVVADLLRAAAFVGIALVDGFALTVALAGLAGVGTSLFNPAALAALPSLVARERLPAATSVYSAVADIGYMVGPGLAALLLLAGGPEEVLLLNGVTFAVSGVVLRLLSFGQRRAPSPARTGRLAPTLVRDAVQGVAVVRGLPAVLTVLLASSAALLFAGTFNVGELLYATEELGADEAQFSLLVAVLGVGFIAGSLSGSRGGSLACLRRRFLGGLAFLGAGYLASGLAWSVPAAACAFAVAGFGNGLLIVYERLLIQALVPDSLTGRVFGMKDALSAWAFAVAFVAGAAVIDLVGVRSAILVCATGAIAAWLGAALLLRGASTPRLAPAAPLAAKMGARER